MTRQIETFEASWNGIQLVITWEPNWLGIERRSEIAAAHLQVGSSCGDPLPFTNTGYRSHFTSRSAVEAAGGPVEYVLTWLAEAAETPEWKRRVEARRQLTLF